MSRHFYFVAAAMACLATTPARTANEISVSANGWTITADPGQGWLTIARDGLGILMRNARLGLRDAPSFSGWTAERGGSNRLNIKTDQPRTGWMLELGLDAL